MPSTFRAFLVSAILALSTTAQLAVAESSCSLVDEAVRISAEIRGLKLKRKVPCKLRTKDEVRAYLLQSLNEKIPQERLASEAALFRFIGVIPEQFDYASGLVELYTDQVGGFYEPKEEYYAMAAWIPEFMQLGVAVHELTHALQDQHYKLETFLDPLTASNDGQLARAALIEGDATAVMVDHTRATVGQGPIQDEATVSGLMAQNILGIMLSPGLQKAPPALQSMLVFPYVSGMNFAHALLRKDGYKSIDAAFRKPPQTSEQILHPEKYLNGEQDWAQFDAPETLSPNSGDPLPPSLAAKLELPPKLEASDVLGEFTISSALSNFITPMKASRAAAGWGGDRAGVYALQGNAIGKRAARWETRWDSEAEAAEFFSALNEAYSSRFAVKKEISQNEVSFTGKSAFEAATKRSGSTVVMVIADL
ncbi:MAG: hypothetical protein IT290_00490 [Deltaproteobacteria bacterium]|nr:hypothetical protein [Deltaproteobacteria bacterium]